MQSLWLLFVVDSSWRLLSLLPAKVSLGGVNQVVYRNERKILQLLLLYKDLSPLDRDSHSAERNRLTYSLCGCFRCGGYSSIGFVLCCYSVRWDHRTQWKERRESPGSGLLGGGVTASPMLTQCNGHKRCLFFLFVRFQTNYIFPLQIRIYTYLEVDVRSQNFLFFGNRFPTANRRHNYYCVVSPHPLVCFSPPLTVVVVVVVVVAGVFRSSSFFGLVCFLVLFFVRVCYGFGYSAANKKKCAVKEERGSSSPLFVLFLCLLDDFPLALDKVPSDKELEKQKEVGSVHEKGRHVVVVSDPAVGASDKEKAEDGQDDPHHHLGYLQRRHQDGPGRTDLDRHEEIVKVHDGMNPVVHHTEIQPTGRLGHVRMPTIQQNRNVMVPMQKDQLFLVNHNKERIHQFAGFQKNQYMRVRVTSCIGLARVLCEINTQSLSLTHTKTHTHTTTTITTRNSRELGKDKELDPESGGSGSVKEFGVTAEVLFHRVVVHVVEELGQGPGEPHGRKEAEAEVPERHEPTPIPRCLRLEVRATKHNQDPVEQTGHDGECRMSHHPISVRHRIEPSLLKQSVHRPKRRIQTGKLVIRNPSHVCKDTFLVERN